MAFLPVTNEEMRDRGWTQPDFVLVTGDAYVDHPSFGHAIISRVLESHGYKVAVLSQPGWKDASDFKRFGRPRLGFLINSGNVDSMVNHYSVFKHRRKSDSYSPGGKAGLRPDRAVIVYSQRAREAYKDVPIIIGGLEASLRRFAHYDYWDNKVRRSILLDAKADMLLYGMGERSIVETAEALDSGISIEHITWIKGTVFKKVGGKGHGEISRLRQVIEEEVPQALFLPSFDDIAEDSEKGKQAYADSFRIQYKNQNRVTGKPLVELYERAGAVVQNPPEPPLTTFEMDHVYELPYEGTWHPSYEEQGGVPAIEEVKFSITANRGCFGGCAFCALTYHQGREVTGRSRESIIREGEKITQLPEFKGYIHDVGGPTANFRGPACKKQQRAGVCTHKDCLYPGPCKDMEVDHSEYIGTLRALRNLPGVKKVFIRSGIRYDYLLADKSGEFLEELCRHHVSGTLKVAPEHISDRVLTRMRKPGRQIFERFSQKYETVNKKLGKKQYLIPYFISSHPGATLEDAVELALYLKKNGFVPDQVQDFYPTPGTVATCMYYTDIDPLTGETVYTAKSIEEKKMQRALLHFHKKENRRLVKDALEKVGREDLISYLR